MSDGLTAAGLTAEHHGWVVRIPADGRPGHHRDIRLGGLRRFSFDGADYVGVLDTDDGSGHVCGTELHLPADTPCALIRRRRSSRPRRGAYPAAAPTPSPGGSAR